MTDATSDDRTGSTSSWEARSDAELFEIRARRVSTPRVGAIDSFRLHAPLELLARQALLQHVDPERRRDVRGRMGAIADSFERSAAPVRSPAAARKQRLPDLRASIAEGDRSGADLWMAAVAPSLSADDLVGALADEVLLRLAGAAHGAILLHLLRRVAPRSPAATQLGRGLVAELAADPGLRIEWIGQPDRPTMLRASETGLSAALASPASPGYPSDSSIAATMSLVDRSGLAADVLSGPTSGLPVSAARRVLLRTAALSMLQDEPTWAPYGWTHCLTMPQATLDIARFCTRPDHAVAVASTYVLGFRSVLGNTSIDPDWRPPRPSPSSSLDVTELLEHGPLHAAAALWHADAEHRPALVRHVAGVAAAHHDAHLAKYTLACLDAARDDRDAAPLYLAAAAYLAAWWHDRDAEP